MPDQSLLAIDIALLLPDEVNERARAANGAMLARRPRGSDALRLDSTHLPHITLVQLFVRRANLPALIESLDPILVSCPPLVLRVDGVGMSTTAAQFVIEPTPALQSLHETLMNAVQPFEESGGGAEAFYAEGEPPRDGDIAWVSRFRTQSGYARFSPHITLGIGPPPEFSEPFEFAVSRAALCRLGRFCTCRVVLREWVREFPQTGGNPHPRPD